MSWHVGVARKGPNIPSRPLRKWAACCLILQIYWIFFRSAFVVDKWPSGGLSSKATQGQVSSEHSPSSHCHTPGYDMIRGDHRKGPTDPKRRSMHASLHCLLHLFYLLPNASLMYNLASEYIKVDCTIMSISSQDVDVVVPGQTKQATEPSKAYNTNKPWETHISTFMLNLLIPQGLIKTVWLSFSK